MLSIVFAIFSQSSSKKKLGVYSNSDKVETFSEATTETKPINTTQYEDTKAGFALNIPSDWKRINQDGTTMFVHQPSASSVTIKISDYDPSVNNTTSESLSESIAGQGKTFVNFVKIPPVIIRFLIRICRIILMIMWTMCTGPETML